MTYTFHIDDASNPKAKAFLAYIKTLDFVRADNDDEFVLTDEQIELLDQRRNDRINGKSKSYTWQEVKKSARATIRNRASE